MFGLAAVIMKERQWILKPQLSGGTFGELNRQFYTQLKTVTARWPSGIREGVEYTIPTLR